MSRLAWVLLACVTACGNISRKQDDGGVRDDVRPKDAPTDVTNVTNDAAADAEILPPTEAREITPGGVHMTGTTFTLEGQFGHAIEQKKSTGTTFTLQGNTAVKP